MVSETTPTQDQQDEQQITVDVPADRVPEFYAFFAHFLAGRRGRRGRGPGRRGHGRGHGHGCRGRGPGESAEQREERAPEGTQQV